MVRAHEHGAFQRDALRRGVGAAAGASKRVEGSGGRRGRVVGVEEGYAHGVEVVVAMG